MQAKRCARGEHVDNTVTLGGLHLAARVKDGAGCVCVDVRGQCLHSFGQSVGSPCLLRRNRAHTPDNGRWTAELFSVRDVLPTRTREGVSTHIFNQ